LFVLLARRAPLALIVRRGPSKWVQLIMWNTQEDTLPSGSTTTTGGSLFVMTGAWPEVTPQRIAELNSGRPHGVMTPEWAQRW
jgi:hypothetical protein